MAQPCLDSLHVCGRVYDSGHLAPTAQFPVVCFLAEPSVAAGYTLDVVRYRRIDGVRSACRRVVASFDAYVGGVSGRVGFQPPFGGVDSHGLLRR